MNLRRLLALLPLTLTLAGCHLESGSKGTLEGVPIWGGEHTIANGGLTTSMTTSGEPTASTAARGPGNTTLEGVPIWGTADTATGGDESNIDVSMFWPQATQQPTEVSVMITSPNPRLTKQAIENEYIGHALPIKYSVAAMTPTARLVIPTKPGTSATSMQPEVFDVTISSSTGSCKTLLNWSNPSLPKTNPLP